MRRWSVVHEVTWTSSNPPGREYCAVKREGSGWALRGTLVRGFKEGTVGVTYVIRTDERWKTKEVQVEELSRGSQRRLDLSVKRGRWFVGDEEQTGLSGCVDVDLEASPVTNTLPLKRTHLKVESKVDLKVAWVRFPSLDVVPLEQGYRRLSKSRYEYRSSTGFVAEIDVDRFGLVKRYGDYWAAV